MTRFAIAIAASALLSGPALAQTVVPGSERPVVAPGTARGATVTGQPGNTGGDRDLTIAPGATGASTIQTDSAAGGNAAQPSRAVPQGSGGR